MRTPLAVATGLVLVAGVLVGVTVSASSADETQPIQPIRVQAPAAEQAPGGPAPGAVPELPTGAAEPGVDPGQSAPQQAAPDPAPRPVTPRQDADGVVAPPPAADDDDDDDDDDDGDDDDDDDDDDD